MTSNHKTKVLISLGRYAHMIKIVQLLILFTSLSVAAQVRTTSGGGDGYYKLWSKIETITLEKVSPSMSIEVKTDLLTIQLLKVAQKCNVPTVVSKDHTFMDSFYHFKWWSIRGPKPSNMSEYLCKAEKEKADCLNNAELKEIVKSIANDPNRHKYLLDKYEIDQKTADSVFDFLSNMGIDPDL